ncbi:MAG: retroviral-like aspartic protease family protein [Magnetococcales bacterium]|nr:retroviral-like aspartic protease family protein [Magnetococcales bacterium]
MISMNAQHLHRPRPRTVWTWLLTASVVAIVLLTTLVARAETTPSDMVDPTRRTSIGQGKGPLNGSSDSSMLNEDGDLDVSSGAWSVSFIKANGEHGTARINGQLVTVGDEFGTEGVIVKAITPDSIILKHKGKEVTLARSSCPGRQSTMRKGRRLLRLSGECPSSLFSGDKGHEIPLVKKGNYIREISVYLNEAVGEGLKVTFIVDTGASAVLIPENIFNTLKEMGGVKPSDMRRQTRVTIADGSVSTRQTFSLRSLRLGGYTVTNVYSIIGEANSTPLLGMNVIERLNAHIDYKRNVLVIGSAGQERKSTTSKSVADLPKEMEEETKSPDSTEDEDSENSTE